MYRNYRLRLRSWNHSWKCCQSHRMVLKKFIRGQSGHISSIFLLRWFLTNVFIIIAYYLYINNMCSSSILDASSSSHICFRRLTLTWCPFHPHKFLSTDSVSIQHRLWIKVNISVRTWPAQKAVALVSCLPEPQLVSNSAFFIVLFIVGTIGNGFMLYVIWKTPQLRSRTNILLAWLTVADITTGFTLTLYVGIYQFSRLRRHEPPLRLHPGLRSFVHDRCDRTSDSDIDDHRNCYRAIRCNSPSFPLHDLDHWSLGKDHSRYMLGCRRGACSQECHILVQCWLFIMCVAVLLGDEMCFWCRNVSHCIRHHASLVWMYSKGCFETKIETGSHAIDIKPGVRQVEEVPDRIEGSQDDSDDPRFHDRPVVPVDGREVLAGDRGHASVHAVLCRPRSLCWSGESSDQLVHLWSLQSGFQECDDEDNEVQTRRWFNVRLGWVNSNNRGSSCNTFNRSIGHNYSCVEHPDFDTCMQS